MRPGVGLSLTLVLSGVLCLEAAGDEQPKPRSDALPRGAISRLGTPRKVKFTTDDFSTFSADGKLFISRRELWDVRTGKRVYSLGPQGRLLFAPDGTPM